MPSNVFSHWWLLILPFSLFLLLFLTPVKISNFVQVQISPVIRTFSTDGFPQLSDSLITHLPEGWRTGPSLGDTILLLLWVLTVWRTGLTVKNRIYQWTKKKVSRLSAERNAAINDILDLQKKKEDLEDHFKRIRNTITSLMMDFWLLKESCKAYEARTLASEKMNRGLKINLENKVKGLETEAEIIKTSLKMTAKRLQQSEGFLQQKLAQEKMLRQESEEKLNSERKASEQTTKKMNTDHENRESSYKNQIEKLTKISTDMKTLLHSTKFENEMLKESSKAFQAMTVNSAKEILRVKTIVEEERSAHHEEINALKTQLNMVTIQAQKKETTLQNKLAQEKALYQETEAKLKETNLEWEEKQGSDKAQIKELLELLASAQKLGTSTKSENEELKESCKAFQQMVKDLTEEMLGLKENNMQERSIHQDEVQSLQKNIEMMTIKMEEKETALLQKLAEEEARTAQANGKFVEYKDDLIKVTKERQNFLKNEIRHFQCKAEDNLIAYRDAENQLARERRKTADLQRRLDALNAKLAQCSQTSYWALEATAQGGVQYNSERLAVDQHRQERQPAFRARRGNKKYSY